MEITQEESVNNKEVLSAFDIINLNYNFFRIPIYKRK